MRGVDTQLGDDGDVDSATFCVHFHTGSSLPGFDSLD
jgi:hypothetical protein